jgi:hypothetical protein
MTQGNFVSEDTYSLIRRAQQTLGGVPVLDLTNWQNPTYMSNAQIRSLPPGSCHSITVKNVITITDTSIVTCSVAATPATNCLIPANCSVGPLSPSDFINMVATVTAQVPQSLVEITFKYVLNDNPTSITKIVTLTTGINTVYAFDSSVQYPVDTTLVLYGAEVTKY